jgi:hypothetical protein
MPQQQCRECLEMGTGGGTTVGGMSVGGTATGAMADLTEGAPWLEGRTVSLGPSQVNWRRRVGELLGKEVRSTGESEQVSMSAGVTDGDLECAKFLLCVCGGVLRAFGATAGAPFAKVFGTVATAAGGTDALANNNVRSWSDIARESTGSIDSLAVEGCSDSSAQTLEETRGAA